MLRIIYGAAGTGKSSSLMREIKDGAGSGARYILLVPEQYSHEAERELCAVCGDGLSLYGEVLSFTGLAREVSGAVGGGAREYLDKGGRLLCMSLAVEGVYARLRAYSSARSRAELQSMLLGAVTELKTACVTSEQLAEASEAASGALADKLYDLSLITEAYDAVAENGAADPTDRMSLLAQEIEDSRCFEGYHIYIDGFTDFTAQERRVLDAMMICGAELTVCLSCDDLSSGSEIFALSRKTARQLMRYARDNGIEVRTELWRGESTKNPDLAYYADNMFTYTAPDDERKTDRIRAYATRSVEEECEFAASEALRLARDEGCRWRDIAVCAKGFDDYRLGLEQAFAAYGVPIYTARRADMLSKPLPTLISAAYETILGGWEAEDVFEYLRTGYAGLDDNECDELESYVFLWQLHGSAWTKPEPWSLHPGGYGKKPDEKSEARLKHINELRETAAEPLRRFAKNAGKAQTAIEQARALAGLLEELGLAEKLSDRAKALADSGRGAEAQETAQLWDIICTALEQCAAVLGDTAADAEYFKSLFMLMLSQYDIGTIPASLDCVTAGEMDRMRRRSIKHLIVIGATEDRIPGTGGDSGIFSADERLRLSELGIDIGGGLDDEMWRSFSDIYNCLTLPSEGLIFCRCEIGESGEKTRSAFVVNRAKALFGIDETRFDVSRARLGAAAPALLCAAQSFSGGGTISASAAKYFSEHEPEKMQKLKRANERGRGKLSKRSVKALYGDRLYLSSSRIDKFSSCRFLYFMRYALKAQPHEPARFSAPEVGTFVHRILERVLSEAHERGGIKLMSDDEIIELTDKYVAEYVSTELNDFREHSARFKHLFRRISADARSIVLDSVAELRRSDFEPLSFELDLSKETKIPPVEIGSEADQLVLTGVIDRVDGWLHDGKIYLRVMDYKTGRKKFNLSDVLYGMNLQMMLYLFALGKYGDRLYGREVVPAGVLYVPARDSVLSIEGNESDADIAKKRTGALRRSGFILNDPDVIAAMEHGDDPAYIPVKVKTGKYPFDPFFSAEQMGLLARRIDETLRDMASELRAGSIAADPYYRSQQENACINCDYFDACRFADGENGESMRSTPRLTATKVWNILEGGGSNG